MRVLAIDYGRARIGLAISDPMGIIAQPLEVLKSRSRQDDIHYIRDLVAEREVERVVVGLPFNMDGTEGPQAAETRRFADDLAKVLNVPIDMWDERLTTFAAESAMLEADLSRAKRKQRRDMVAACMILRGYLDANG